MRIISRSTLTRYVATLTGRKDKTAVDSSLRAWYAEAAAAEWRGPADIKSEFTNASFVGSDRVVFNIKGNSYRLVVAVDYERQLVFIKWVGNHQQYDRIDIRTVRYDDKAY